MKEPTLENFIQNWWSISVVPLIKKPVGAVCTYDEFTEIVKNVEQARKPIESFIKKMDDWESVQCFKKICDCLNTHLNTIDNYLTDIGLEP